MWLPTTSVFNHTVKGDLGRDQTVSLEAGWNIAEYPRRDYLTVLGVIFQCSVSTSLNLSV
jgi:hypothetical protein